MMRTPLLGSLVAVAFIGASVAVAFAISAADQESEPSTQRAAASDHQQEAAPPLAAGAWPAARGQLPRELTGGGILLNLSAGSSLEALVHFSDAVVIGTIESAELVDKPKPITIPVGKLPCEENPENAGKGRCPEPEATVTTLWGDYVTRYTVRVEQYLKSPPDRPATLAVRVIGGVADGVEHVVYPFPFFYVGQQYLLFLFDHPNYPGEMYPTAESFGTFALSSGVLEPADGSEDAQLGPANTTVGALGALYHLELNDAISKVRNIVAAQEPVTP